MHAPELVARCNEAITTRDNTSNAAAGNGSLQVRWSNYPTFGPEPSSFGLETGQLAVRWTGTFHSTSYRPRQPGEPEQLAEIARLVGCGVCGIVHADGRELEAANRRG